MTMKLFTNNLIVKNQLINSPTDKITELYKDRNNYIDFIDSVVSLIEIESIFFALDESFSEKIKNIIYNENFEIDEELFQKINYITTFIDSISYTPPIIKNIKKNCYLLYQEDMRDTTFKNHQEFLNSLAYDAVVMNAILKNDFSKIYKFDLLSHSINYLMNLIPDFFEDKEILDNMIKNLDYIGEKMFNIKTLNLTLK